MCKESRSRPESCRNHVDGPDDRIGERWSVARIGASAVVDVQQPLPPRGFGFADLSLLANHVLAVRADPDGSHSWWCEHANVGVGDELLAVAAVRHGQQSLHSNTLKTYGANQCSQVRSRFLLIRIDLGFEFGKHRRSEKRTSADTSTSSASRADGVVVVVNYTILLAENESQLHPRVNHARLGEVSPGADCIHHRRCKYARKQSLNQRY